MFEVKSQECFGMSVQWDDEESTSDSAIFPAKTMLPWPERLRMAKDFALREEEAVIPYAFGSWFRSLAALKLAGLSRATIQLPRRQNFKLQPLRTAIVVNEWKALFLPVYKCGSSSFRRFVHDHAAEHADKDDSNSTSLNSTLNPRDPMFANFFRFAFARDPEDRFLSFYKEKILRSTSEKNRLFYAEPIRVLMDVPTLRAVDVMRFISYIPPEFCDPHFKPQHLTLKYQNVPLVDRIYALGDCRWAAELGLQHEFPVRLSTSYMDDALAEDSSILDALRMVREYYNNDFDLMRYGDCECMGSDTLDA